MKLLHDNSGVIGRSDVMKSGVYGQEEDRDKVQPMKAPFKSEVRHESVQNKEVNFNKKGKAPLDEDVVVREEKSIEIKSKVEVIEPSKGKEVDQNERAGELVEKDVIEMEKIGEIKVDVEKEINV